MQYILILINNQNVLTGIFDPITLFSMLKIESDYEKPPMGFTYPQAAYSNTVFPVTI